MDGDADRPRLVGERAGDRLPDPPGGVGRELEALAVVELLRRANQPDRAFLDQVEERQRRVVELRFGLNGEPPQTLDEVGRTFNVTRERIRQIESQTLQRLRALRSSF